MKTILCFLLVFFGYHSVMAKKIEMTLREAKNWHRTEALDSVVVSFQAKGHQLEFRQSFKIIKGVNSSKQITLNQKDKDLDHFKSALLIMTTASAKAISGNPEEIKVNKYGLSSCIIFEQYLTSSDSWHSMCAIFSWAKLFGKAQNIRVTAYVRS